MRIVVSVALLLICMFMLSFQDVKYVQPTASATDTIQWRGNYRLQLEDFEGPVDRNSNHAAITATSINYYFVYNNDHVSITTEAVFYKKESWLNRDLVAEYNYTLKHEQGHFDIAEIYARRLQVLLNNFLTNSTNKDADMQNVYEELMAEQRAMQQLYDKETQNSMNAKKQFEWNKRIHAMLNEREMD